MKNLHKRGRVKVSRKQNFRDGKLKRGIGDKRVADLWDQKLTARQNYEKMGLAVNPNTEQELKAHLVGRLTETPSVEMVDIIDGKAVLPDDVLRERNPRRPLYFVGEDEAAYLDALIAKYPDDYKAMERDVKLNVEQHSAAHLKTRISRLKKFRAASSSAK